MTFSVFKLIQVDYFLLLLALLHNGCGVSLPANDEE